MHPHSEISLIDTPPVQQGFLGAGHLASPLIQRDFAHSDPFILLMDDRLTRTDDQPMGGPHPHAGFETVSLLLDGEIGNGAHRMRKGDMQLMTAGKGVIHTETIEGKASMHLLQLWLNLPKKDRWAEPRVQDLPLEKAPSRTQDGVSTRVYSGSLSGLTSPVLNHTPLLLVDIRLQAGVTTVYQIPGSYTAFLYVLEGSVRVGEQARDLRQGQVGWLDKHAGDGLSDLRLSAPDSEARLVLYAAEPQHHPIVSHGPFIGDVQEDIRELYQAYRQGKMSPITSVPAAQQIQW